MARIAAIALANRGPEKLQKKRPRMGRTHAPLIQSRARPRSLERFRSLSSVGFLGISLKCNASIGLNLNWGCQLSAPPAQLHPFSALQPMERYCKVRPRQEEKARIFAVSPAFEGNTTAVLEHFLLLL
jgi:hypothetical protein